MVRGRSPSTVARGLDIARPGHSGDRFPPTIACAQFLGAVFKVDLRHPETLAIWSDGLFRGAVECIDRSEYMTRTDRYSVNPVIALTDVAGADGMKGEGGNDTFFEPNGDIF